MVAVVAAAAASMPPRSKGGRTHLFFVLSSRVAAIVRSCGPNYCACDDGTFLLEVDEERRRMALR